MAKKYKVFCLHIPSNKITVETVAAEDFEIFLGDINYWNGNYKDYKYWYKNPDMS